MDSPIARHSSTPGELQARIQAERSGQPFLVYRDGERRQRILELAEEMQRVAIGRRSQNDVTIDWDLEVSRLHAIVERIGGEWTISDDGLSSNGSYVNGERLSGRHRLEDGDTILLGRTAFVFREPGASRIDSTAAAGASPTRASLSERQREVLVALCRPYRDDPSFAIPATNDAIGEEVHLSPDAVKSHLRELFKKFAIQELPQGLKRARLVALAFQSGLVSDRDFG
jgi:pSer/pThr/pTyr-binding forkhead associated (FHA) protein